MAPSPPLGPLIDGVVTWTTWVTMMGAFGVTVLASLAGPVARRGGGGLTPVTVRLARVGLPLAVLALPAVLTDSAHGLDETGGYDYGAAWNALYDGTNSGRLLGIQFTALAVGVVLIAPLTVARFAAAPVRRWLLLGSALTSAVALATTKFPDEVPAKWGRTTFETFMWMLHLLGGGVWIGGLIGLLALALPGGVPAGARSAFWGPLIRRFSITAMSCVAAIALSGLWLYWEHVDGPSQLFSTMYGRTLLVKVIVFGALLLLGVVNQFWLHPRIEALRAAGDERPLRTILIREFRVTLALEVLFALTVLMIAPFLHGSARNQAFQADAAQQLAPGAKLPKIAAKEVSASTWMWGTAETVIVIGLMAGGYRVSGRLARGQVAARGESEPAPV
jgi:putative copper export protein